MSQTFKRIALVAVAALSLGGLTAVSSNAAPFNDTLTQSNATSTTANDGSGAYPAVYDTITATFFGSAGDYETLTVSRLTAPLTSTTGGTIDTVTVPGTTTDSATPINGYSVKVVTGSGAASTTGKMIIKFTPDVAGVYTLKITPTFGSGTPAAAPLIWTVTATDPAYNHSVALISGDVAGATVVTSTDSATAITASATASPTTAVAKISVTQWSSTTAGDTVTAVSTAAAQAVTVTISGAGALSTDSSATAGLSYSVAKTAATSSAKSFNVFVFPNGQSGVATITVSVGSETYKKTVGFYGTLSSYTVDAAPNTYLGVGASESVWVRGADVNSVAVNPGLIYAFSSDTSVATVSTATSAAGTAYETVTVTGVKSGTTTVTVGNASTLAASTKTKTFTINVSKTTAKTVSITTDKASYLPGEKITVTVSAVDSLGYPVADGTVALFAANKGLTSSVTLTSPSFDSNSAMALVGGKITFTAYAPTYGPFVISGTEGTGTDNVAAGGTAATISSASVDVTNVAADLAQSAIDAAQEATDAANAAYDAANNAMDSADAATAAAQEASDNAAAALAAVTELATTVASLVAKVNAIATTLAKIAKKVKA